MLCYFANLISGMDLLIPYVKNVFSFSQMLSSVTTVM